MHNSQTMKRRSNVGQISFCYLETGAEKPRSEESVMKVHKVLAEMIGLYNLMDDKASLSRRAQ